MYSVIMAGGSGTRFWPASRRKKPKQFLEIAGEEPMVLETCNRLSPLSRDEEMIIVLGRDHVDLANEIFEARGIHILAEPIGRNTAPCIGLGALYAAHLGCRDPIAFLPADHFIGDPDAFRACLVTGRDLARSGGIVTLGITPTRPETGYGYIRAEKTPGTTGDKKASHRVAAFVEKPDLPTARRYLSEGTYFWNAGIFLATPDTILRAFEECLPQAYTGLLRLKEATGRGELDREIEGVYKALETVSFDYGIMERTREPVHVVPCECGWSDVGSWESLYMLKQEAHDGDRNLSEEDSLLIGCKGCFVSNRGGRLVVCLGLEDCLVADTPGALLVAGLNQSQDIRKVIDRLKELQKDDVL